MNYCPTCGRVLISGGCPLCSFAAAQTQTTKRPHKCPVCDGAGHVSRPPNVAGDVPSWSSASLRTYPCLACAGTGVLWA